MKSYLAIYVPRNASQGSEQVLREVIAGAYAEAARCKCPFFVQQVRMEESVQESLGLIGMLSARSQTEKMLKLKIPLVNVSNLFGPVKGMANVLSDDDAVGRMAAEHLLSKGYRHFLAAGEKGPQWSQERLKGFIGAIQEAGQTVQALDLDFTGPSKKETPGGYAESIWEQVHPLLRDAPLATGIFAANDWLAWPILEEIRANAPERLHTTALLGVDNLHDQLFDPNRTAGLSSVQPGFRQAGARSLQLLIDAVQNGTDIRKVSDRVPPVKVLTRGSTAGSACEDPVVSAVVRELWVGIQQNEAPSIRTLARQHGMSLRNMELRFEAQLGQSARMLIADMRIQRGQELLRDSGLAITEVSRRCGYANSTTFSTLFSKKNGLTPRQWRRQHQPVSAPI